MLTSDSEQSLNSYVCWLCGHREQTSESAEIMRAIACPQCMLDGSLVPLVSSENQSAIESSAQ